MHIYRIIIFLIFLTGILIYTRSLFISKVFAGTFFYTATVIVYDRQIIGTMLPPRSISSFVVTSIFIICEVNLFF